MTPFAIVLLLVAAASAPIPAPAKRTAPPRSPAANAVAGAPGSPTDFSGSWQVDSKASAGGSPNMESAVLEVTQKGERIWIQPVGSARQGVIAEEVVVDGRSYEKSLGGGRKGILVAKWGTDAKSLWLEVSAGPEQNPREAVQRSVWRLSDDRSTWVRETITIQEGTSRRSRLVFRRIDPSKAKTPTPEAGGSR